MDQVESGGVSTEGVTQYNIFKYPQLQPATAEKTCNLVHLQEEIWINPAIYRNLVLLQTLILQRLFYWL